MELTRPAKLDETHDLSTFDCGEDSINEYLVKKALKSQRAKHASVFVTCIKGTATVVGYYTLSSGQVLRSSVVPKKAQRNLPDMHPVTLLGRMGVCINAQGQGLSHDLLKDAIKRSLWASDAVASTANDAAFYLSRAATCLLSSGIAAQTRVNLLAPGTASPQAELMRLGWRDPDGLLATAQHRPFRKKHRPRQG